MTFEIEFCLLSFSAQERENVDTLSFNLSKSETGLSKDLVVAIDFFNLRILNLNLRFLSILVGF
jgi:hypothetical protein